MRDFDEEVKERNDMLDDILNKMHDDVENGTMDEDDYYDEEMNLIDDTCTWSVSVELSKGRDEIKSTMAVNIESGDADVVDSDTLSVDDVEKWCKKKSESRISRRRGIRRIIEARRNFDKKEAKGKFIRRINPSATGEEKKLTLKDLDVNPAVEYIGLFVNGYDVGGLEPVYLNRPAWDQLVPLMEKLDNEILEIKGSPNKKIESWIYLCDEDDNNEVTVEIPDIYTDSQGRIVFDDSKGYPRRVKDMNDLCLVAFHKLLKNM